MLGTVLVLSAFFAQPLPQTGPLYDLLDAYAQAQPSTPEEQTRWANDIYAALQANPNEEWSTRVRAYEEAGSIYWRLSDYNHAAPIFLEQLQEAANHGDSGESIRALDSLTNLYGEAQFPIQDRLDFYDATEAWLQQPPPGEEDRYASMLHDVYGERANVLAQFAENNAANDRERQQYLQEADYFRQLAEGTAQVAHVPHKTFADIARAWFEKNGHLGDQKATAPAEDKPVMKKPAKADPAPAVEPLPAPREEPLPPLTPLTPPAPSTPTDSGLSSEVIIGTCLGVILLGWAVAAFLYLRRNR